MNDVREVFGTIQENPGLRQSQLVEMLDIPRALRVTRDDEKVFRHFAP